VYRQWEGLGRVWESWERLGRVWVFVTKFCEKASRRQLKRFIPNLDGLGARGSPLEPLGPSARNGQELRVRVVNRTKCNSSQENPKH
jgi:hypothetical protein